MKKVVIAGAVVIILLVLGLIFLEPNEEVPLMAESSSDAPTMLKSLAKDVLISLSTDSESSVVEEETEVVNGNKINTSAAGRALLTQGSEIVTSLDSNSELTIDLNREEKSSVIKMAAGKTWTKITRALEQDEVYEVHTPTIVAAVRGTSFGVYTEPESRIIVTEGIVWASVIDPETGLIDSGTTIEVPAGKMVIYNDGKLVIRDIGESDKGEWYFENNPENSDDEEGQEADTTKDTNTKPATSNESEVVLNSSVNTSEVSNETELEADTTTVEEGRDLEAVNEGQNDDFVEAGTSNDTRTETSPVLAALTIKDAKVGSTQSPQEYVILSGTGFTQVETILVNGQENRFQNIGDTEIHMFDFSLSNVRTIKIVTATDSIIYNP